jgi:hypothetical protein
MGKIKILILSIIIFLFHCSDEKVKKTTLQEINLKGKVLYLQEYQYKAIEKFGEVVKDSLLRTYIYKFDKNGYILEDIMFNSDSSLYQRLDFKYDQNYNIIEICAYDNMQNLIMRDAYLQNLNGNVKEVNSYDSKGTLQSKNIFKYDDNHNEIENNYYNPDGSLKSKRIFRYDGKGNKTEEIGFSSDGIIQSKREFKYDNRRNKVEENILIDEYGITTGEKFTFIYDNFGNTIEAIYYFADGKIRSKVLHKYEFDSKDNWIKEIRFLNEKPESVIEREIRYAH